MSREWTRDEVQAAFVAHIQALVGCWRDKPDPAHGVAFSILVMLDGAANELPKFQVVADPHPDDRAFLQEQGENWYPEAHDSDQDISGALHEAFVSTCKPWSSSSSESGNSNTSPAAGTDGDGADGLAER